MDIRPIKTDADHAAALEEIDRLWGAEEGTPEGDKLDVLVTLVEAYEAKRWPIEACDPIDYLKGMMEMQGRTQSDLAELLGSRARASEVLARKRYLTKGMIERIAALWHISAAPLLKPYKLAKSNVKGDKRRAA